MIKKSYISLAWISLLVLTIFYSEVSAQACVDGGNCRLLSAFCKNNAAIRNICRKTCNNCGCTDVLPNCAVLLSQCSTANVKQYCCHTCSVTEEVKPTDPPDNGNGGGGDESCKYEESWCEDYKSDCETDDYVKQHCKITCGGCDSGGAKWSDWTDWVCGVTCGSGTEERTRKCVRGKCKGAAKQSRACTRNPCTVAAKWSKWSKWRCDVTCGQGTEERTRSCKKGDCKGPTIENRVCQLADCQGDEDCKYEEGWCGRHKSKCETNDYVKKQCKITCGVCDSEASTCTDNENWCDQDGVRAICQTDTYVQKNCKKTCNLCNTAGEQWSEWSSWVCDTTCGEGMETRTRTCLSGNNCKDDDKMERPCTQNNPCPVWDQWKDWGPCSKDCGGGTQDRSRDCIQGNCDAAKSFETKECNTFACENNRAYSDWTNFGPCNAQCGGGTHERSRICLDGQCNEHDLEQKLCNEESCGGDPTCEDRHTACSDNAHLCKRDNVLYWCPKTCGTCEGGSGAQWSTFGPCNVNCGVGWQTRTKEGVTQAITCNTNVPCTGEPDKGEWSEFGPFGECSKTCGPGTWERTRSCSIPNGCSSGEAVDKQPCNIEPCPVWQQWSVWSDCSESCGPGILTRNRQCSVFGKCEGEIRDRKECFIKACEVPVWREWTTWTTCSKTCGRGDQSRERACSITGKCVGEIAQKRSCTIEACVVPSWKPWSTWSDCSETCGRGKKTRERVCSVEGKCEGKTVGQRNCFIEKCVAIEWKHWTQWSECTESCGNGIRTRTRECSVPDKCEGQKKMEEKCNTFLCPTWSDWSNWGKCDKACGQGVTKRTRSCSVKGKCTGNRKETKSCKIIDCAGGDKWTDCTRKCGGGTRKKRKCDNEGSNCNYTYEGCGEDVCPTVVCARKGANYRNRYGASNQCCTTGRLPIGETCGRSLADRRVIGGRNAQANRWPWMAVFSMVGFCSGSIISDKFILTAAHCFQEDDGTPRLQDWWTALLGVLDIAKLNVKTYEHSYLIAAAYVHKQYAFPLHDIAIVELAKKIPKWSNAIHPICLPWGEETPYDTKCFVAGWGVSNVTDALTDHLQELSVTNFEPEVCLEAYSTRDHLSHHTEFLRDTKGFLCAGSITAETDSCSGDSGGPLVCQRCSNCNWYITGVVSFGPNPCAEIGVPGVYSKVVYYEDWIYGITKMKKHSRSCASP